MMKRYEEMKGMRGDEKKMKKRMRKRNRMKR